MKLTTALYKPKFNHFLHIVFFICCISAYGQEPVLKLKNHKNYNLYFVNVSNPNNVNYRIDSIKNFFIVKWDDRESFRIEDRKAIEALKKSWTAKKTEEFHFCWNDYFAFVVEDDKIINELRISEKCQQVVCFDGIYKYNDPILPGLDKSNTISVARLDFKSVPFGRTFLNDAKSHDGIFIQEGSHDEWLTYDGKLTISVEHDQDTVQTADRLTQKIKNKFPQDPFKIKLSGSGPGYLLYDIYCHKELEANLNEFKVDSKWVELDASTITLFSSSQQLIQELIEKHAARND